MYYLVEPGAKPPPDCSIEIYNLWFRMFAKGTNFHTLDEVFVMGVDETQINQDHTAGEGVNWG